MDIKIIATQSERIIQVSVIDKRAFCLKSNKLRAQFLKSSTHQRAQRALKTIVQASEKQFDYTTDNGFLLRELQI